ncbi:Nse4 C-terminal-domain-containing protein [Boletus reticuloceps]|uniref:Non-structural maintenance of chromosomes element 4 n=1 Tax=Boletus reticuloceps TaxID=495285 RepID=A0A8I2YUG7_9AGAM|nr:Nse4 C-terminal-domain-containing protein [Boletus reticuloceps]
MDHADSPAYDPDQDAAEKRDIRKKYRLLEKKTGENLRPQDHDAEDLAGQIAQADELFSKVKNPTEATLDSTVLRNVSSIGAQKARAMKLGSAAFDMDDFVSKLITFMGGKHRFEDEEGEEMEVVEEGTLDWDKIGRMALAKSRRVPVTGFMYPPSVVPRWFGLLIDFQVRPSSIEQKKRGPIKRQQQEKVQEEESKPQEIKEDDIKRSDNETTKNVLKIKDLLEATGPINIFKFIVNPNDFAQSVENLFYLSFVIRDGECAFEINDNGEPIVMRCEQPTMEDRAGGVHARQIVMEFDMATWKRAIEVWNITESQIPQRPSAKTKIGDKWYG